MEPESSLVKIVVVLEGLLAALIVGLAIEFYFHGATKDSLEFVKAVYDIVVLQTLLPLFKTTIAAVLTWIFGKPVVQALVSRFKISRPE